MTERLPLEPTRPHANHPMKDVALEPLVVSHDGRFFDAPLDLDLDHCAPVIVARPGDRRYVSAPDWVLPSASSRRRFERQAGR